MRRVTGVSDAGVGDESVIVALSASSSDSDYQGLVGSLPVAVADDDTGGLVDRLSGAALTQRRTASAVLGVVHLNTNVWPNEPKVQTVSR